MAREASRDGLDDEVLRDICANSRVSGEAEVLSILLTSSEFAWTPVEKH